MNTVCQKRRDIQLRYHHRRHTARLDGPLFLSISNGGGDHSCRRLHLCWSSIPIGCGLTTLCRQYQPYSRHCVWRSGFHLRRWCACLLEFEGLKPLHGDASLSWIPPILCFSLLVGLGLTTISFWSGEFEENRERRSDIDAIISVVSGSTITAAGMIMATVQWLAIFVEPSLTRLPSSSFSPCWWTRSSYARSSFQASWSCSHIQLRLKNW